jgi:hypothetical protein
MVSPLTGRPVTLATARIAANADATTRFADAFGDFLIDASPIRPARAQTGFAEVDDTLRPSAVE